MSADRRNFKSDGCLSSIGDTPLQPVLVTVGGVCREIYLKLEGLNPTGSVKDRTAIGMFRFLEDQQKLNNKSVIIESTSGNLGVSLSWICRLKGLNFVAVVDPKATRENLAKMKDFGAIIEMVNEHDGHGGYLSSRLKRVHQLCDANADFIWTDQYSNLANPGIHFSSTGPELLRQMNGDLTAVFIAVSTGGTLGGIARYLRQASPKTRICAVDAVGSIIFGGEPAIRKLTGIGSNQHSRFISPDLYDQIFKISDTAAFACCHALAKNTGILVGGSSGAVLAACGQYLSRNPECERVACICADGGDSYASSIFNEKWLQQHDVALVDNDLSPIERFRMPLVFGHETLR